MKKVTSRTFVLSAVVCGIALLAGCSSEEKKSDASTNKAMTTAAAENKKCPMSGEAVNASAKTVSFQGHTVGFCCDKCSANFAGMTDAQKAEKWKTVAMAK